ncbi:neuroendocrine protein 7B2-like [Watersipora subatra]|uniref:neuroendocrine protein 7B2-like n=1 Tax=Watersipora subatra TaxID=2589382 RepID=UPI00355B565B
MISFVWKSYFLIGLAGLRGAAQGFDGGSFRDDQTRNHMLAELYGEIEDTLAKISHNSYGSSQSEQSMPSIHLSQTNDHDYENTVSPKWVNIRHPEEENNVALSGYQSMSGGAGEGKQHLKPEGSVNNKQEVKTDADLPSYCSPPNPCPKGKTAADGCQERIPDTAEFNRDYVLAQMKEGYCGCDYEHMEEESCPIETSDLYGLRLPEIDAVLDGIFDSERGEGKIHKENPYVSNGEKRKSMTGKKGGKMDISKRSVEKVMSMPVNRYLQGVKLPVVAKKSPQMNLPEL